jgi:hypothetical protein
MLHIIFLKQRERDIQIFKFWTMQVKTALPVTVSCADCVATNMDNKDTVVFYILQTAIFFRNNLPIIVGNVPCVLNKFL